MALGLIFNRFKLLENDSSPTSQIDVFFWLVPWRGWVEALATTRCGFDAAVAEAQPRVRAP